MSGMLPDHTPHQVAPLWRPLMADPCRRCGSASVHAQHMSQEGSVNRFTARLGEPPDPEMADSRLHLTVLCGGCGDVDERHGWQPTAEVLLEERRARGEGD